MERRIATRTEDLPALKEGYARLVHLTNEEHAQSIAQLGLNYKGMISTTAIAYANPNEAKFASEDSRFRNAHAVVIDMSFEELKLHDWRTGKPGPGLVPKEYIVGIVKPRKPAMTDEEFRKYVMNA